MEKANIVITHGGTGAIIGAVKKGKKVIAVPRLAKYGEHVDDHQLQLIKKFDDLADPRMNVSDMVVNLLDVLPLKGAQVNTFRSASSLQIAVCDGLPTVPPDLGILLVVPVHRVFLVHFQLPEGSWMRSVSYTHLDVYKRQARVAGVPSPLRSAWPRPPSLAPAEQFTLSSGISSAPARSIADRSVSSV